MYVHHIELFKSNYFSFTSTLSICTTFFLSSLLDLKSALVGFIINLFIKCITYWILFMSLYHVWLSKVTENKIGFIVTVYVTTYHNLQLHRDWFKKKYFKIDFYIHIYTFVMQTLYSATLYRRITVFVLILNGENYNFHYSNTCI